MPLWSSRLFGSLRWAHQGSVDQPSRPCDAVLAVYTFRSLMPPIRSAFLAVTCNP